MSGQDARVPGSHGSHGWKDCLLASRPCERAERPGRGPSVKLTGFPGDQAPGFSLLFYHLFMYLYLINCLVLVGFDPLYKYDDHILLF